MGLIGNIQGSQGPAGPAGPAGSTGAAGTAGTQWFTMNVDPTSPGDDGVGVNGDIWLNLNTGNLYKKTSGTWV